MKNSKNILITLWIAATILIWWAGFPQKGKKTEKENDKNKIELAGNLEATKQSDIDPRFIWKNNTPQNKKNVKDDSKNKLKTNLEQNELSHNQIIKMKIDDILKFYGNDKKWLEVVKEHIFIEINKARTRNWSNPLKSDSLLDKSAQKHAEELAKNDLLEHTNSNNQNVGDRAEAEWFNYSWIASNIADGSDIQTVVNGFVKSTKWWHEAIIDGKKWIVVGVWIAKYSQDPGKWCFVFDYAVPTTTK